MPFALSSIAVILSFVAFGLYIKSIVANKTDPHPFSWLIWGLTTCVIFTAQLADGAGVGAIAIGFSGVAALFIAVLSLKYSRNRKVSSMDMLCLFSAVISLSLWYFTSDPLWAVVIITLVDSLGFIPTIRKAYYDPFREPIFFPALMGIRSLLVLASLENYSITTVLFPLTVAGFCVVLISVLLLRRPVVGANIKH